MKKNQTTVTIGIPAYNEEKHIKSLLDAILQQKEEGFRIEKIFVVSDGSTDRTDAIVHRFKDKRMKFIKNVTRKGQTYSQNIIFKSSHTKIVVLFEADTYPADDLYLYKLIQPLLSDHTIGMMQGNPVSLESKTYVQKVLKTQTAIYKQIMLDQPNASDMFCAGQGGRAFTQEVYSKLLWPSDVPEDTYALLWCKERNIKTKFVSAAVCWFRSSTNITDYLLARKKISAGKEVLYRYFDSTLIDQLYYSSKILTLKMMFWFAISDPVTFFHYVLFKARLRLSSSKNKYSDFWPTTKSKELIRNKINNRSPTVTIGISAFNEENNIEQLVLGLLKQRQTHYILSRIIVSSDGSTDRTVELVEKIRNSKVNIIKNRERKGNGYRQNQIIDQTDSDILVLLNADIYIKDISFIEGLIKPIIQGSADMTSSLLKPFPTKRFFASILNISTEIKNEAFGGYKSGRNIYTCHGTMRALSSRLYKKLEFKKSVGEDAYSFLYCLINGFKYTYVKTAVAYIKSPENFRDHQKQSVRFFSSQQILKREFGEELVTSEYAYPFTILLVPLISYGLRYPLHLFFYFFVLLYMKFKSQYVSYSKDTWDIAKSSKLITLDHETT